MVATFAPFVVKIFTFDYESTEIPFLLSDRVPVLQLQLKLAGFLAVK